MVDASFALRLEADDGTVRDVPVSFDVDALTPGERAAAISRWDGETPALLAASLIFEKTGLPDDEWPGVAPVLLAAIDGSDLSALVIV